MYLDPVSQCVLYTPSCTTVHRSCNVAGTRTAGVLIGTQIYWGEANKQCVDKPTRCNTSYEWSLFSIMWLYIFRTITSPSTGASSRKLYNALVCSCYQASLSSCCIHATARLARTNIQMRHTVYEMMLLVGCTSTQQLDSLDSTNIPVRYTVYEMMLLMMVWW